MNWGDNGVVDVFQKSKLKMGCGYVCENELKLRNSVRGRRRKVQRKNGVEIVKMRDNRLLKGNLNSKVKESFELRAR